MPNTNTGIRLSSARDLFGNQIIIEKQGISPDVLIETMETAAEFEARYRDVINGAHVLDFSKDALPAAIKQQFLNSL